MSNATLQLGGGNFAVKDGKLLGYATDPKTSVFVSREFNFSRGSNLAATRVDANGLIEKGRENLLTHSNTFDNVAWNYAANGLTRTASSITDPDGGTNAWEITTTATNDYHRLGHAIASGQVKTFSFYAKANGYEYVRFWAFSGGNTGTNYFHLSGAGTAFGSGQLGILSIESVGNGWYRCQGVLDPLNSGGLVIGPAPDASTSLNTGTYLADGTSGIYLYNAQLEAGLVATDYIETGATTVQAGILEDMPRIDYTNSSSPALLLEPQRTNLYKHSEYIFNFQGTQTFNNSNSPEGVSNAVLLTKTSASDQFVNMSWSGSSLSASTDYTMSLFVKHNGDDVDVRYEYNNSNDWGKAWTALFQVRASGVTASTTSNCTSDVEDYGNGWYRILVFVDTASSITPSSPSNLLRIIGASGDEVLVYGAGMEQGSYPTSYIPTYGTAVTRSRELLYITNMSSNIASGATSATLFLDFEFRKNLTADALTFQSSGSALGRGYLYDVRMGMADSYGIYIALTQDTQQKCIWRLNTLSNASVFANGTKGNTNNGNAWNDVNRIELDGNRWSFRINNMMLFDQALTDSECITLTTL